MKYIAMLKSEMARAAGVSTSTFRRWLINDEAALRGMGIQPNAKLLPPCAVKYLCERYCIDLYDAATGEKTAK